MINIYGKNNTNYNTNGDATLIPIRADLNITLNGRWQLEVEVPYDKENRYELIEEGAVIICDVGCIRELASTRQRFRIYDYKKGISSVTAIAFPIAMESTHDAPIDNLVISGKTGVQAMAQIQAKTSKYTLYSDITRTGSTSFANTNVNNAIASGSEGCFIDVWGGEIVYDNLKFSVLNRVGNNEQDKHKIIYGKDITDISYEKDDSGLITRIYPISSDGIRLNGSGYVDSPKINLYPIIHSRYMSAPYELIEDDIASSTATAQLTRSIKSQITTLASSLSHSVYNTAVASKVEPEYIRKIKADILSAVQSMATATIYNADANKVMQSAIKDGMEWLKDVSKAEWVWHGSDATGWWYGSSTSDRATSQYVYIDRVWSYFGDNSLWQKPRDDDSKKWDWIQEASGKRYGNKDKYYAQKTYVYITMNGQMKEYYFDDDGIWDESDDTDSSYAWHGSGSSSDPYWFGDDSTTGKYLKDGWWFIDGTYYYFDSEGYWDNETKFDDYQWDWVETADGKYWFGNPDKTFAMTYVTNQWLKVGGDWYRFDANGYAVGDTALENEVIARFTSGMAQLKTLCETLNTQAFNLLYSQMRSYCTKLFNTGIDVPSVTITVNMADLSNTSEYAKYQHLEKIYLGDSVTALDYKHNISAVERIVSITYDCIKKVNAVVEIGVASSSLSDILKTDAGGSVAGGFDTSAIESALTSHGNSIASLQANKQDKLTAGENISIVNNVISATGGGNGHNAYYGITPPNASLGEDESIYYQLVGQCSELVLEEEYQWSELYNDGSKIIVKGTSAGVTEAVIYRLDDLIVGSDITVSFKGQLTRDGGGNTEFYQYEPIETNRYVFGFEITDDISGVTTVTKVPDLSGDYSWFEEDNLRHNYTMTTEATATTMYMVLYFQDIIDGETDTFTITDFVWSGGQITRYTISDLWQKVGDTWVSSEFGEINIFEGATATSDGEKGLVPKPNEGDDTKFLKGDGTWAIPLELETNPSDTATALLKKIKINGSTYNSINTVDITEEEYTDLPSSKYSDDYLYMVKSVEDIFDGDSTITLLGSNGVTLQESAVSGNVGTLKAYEYSAGHEGFNIALKNLTVGNTYKLEFDFQFTSAQFIGTDYRCAYLISATQNTNYSDYGQWTENIPRDLLKHHHSVSFTASSTTMYVAFNLDGCSDSVNNYFTMSDIYVIDVDSKNKIMYNGNQYGASAGGGSVSDLTDVDLTNLSNGQILKYNSTSQKWENANESGGSGNLSAQEITYAQWQALTEEQKMAEVEYHITDYPDGAVFPLTVENGKLCIIWQREVTS